MDGQMGTQVTKEVVSTSAAECNQLAVPISDVYVNCIKSV